MIKNLILRKVRKFSKCGLDFLMHFMKGEENAKCLYIAYSDSSQKLDQLTYFKFYYNISTSKVTAGQRNDCNQCFAYATHCDRQSRSAEAEAGTYGRPRI